jgi:mono/diheme cytochrome c family protein
MEPYIKTSLTLLAVLASTGLLLPSPVLAHDADDIGHGREIARTICAACHARSQGSISITQ